MGCLIRSLHGAIYRFTQKLHGFSSRLPSEIPEIIRARMWFKSMQHSPGPSFQRRINCWWDLRKPGFCIRESRRPLRFPFRAHRLHPMTRRKAHGCWSGENTESMWEKAAGNCSRRQRWCWRERLLRSSAVLCSGERKQISFSQSTVQAYPISAPQFLLIRSPYRPSPTLTPERRPLSLPQHAGLAFPMLHLGKQRLRNWQDS